MPTSEHFSAEELACHCGCGEGEEHISPRLLELAEQLRANIGGIPLTINSAYRCPEWNELQSGVPNSQHTEGNALDIACPEHLTMGEFLWYIQQLEGFDGVGVYPMTDMEHTGGFIHVDVRYGGYCDDDDERIYWYEWEDGWEPDDWEDD